MTMTALSFDRYGSPAVLSLVERDIPVPKQGEALIEVKAAAINPSDIRIVEGMFHSALPRTPGRDYAGTVAAGDAPAGKDVWGSGPGFGIARDGAHTLCCGQYAGRCRALAAGQPSATGSISLSTIRAALAGNLGQTARALFALASCRASPGMAPR